MKPYKVDRNGIPVLSRTDIEEWAEQFVNYFGPKCTKAPQPTPLPTICQKLKDEHGVNFVFGIDLGNSPQGYKYRGRFHIPSTTIYIDKSLEWNDPRFNFTLAHELAHFVLHRKIETKILITEKEAEISDTNRQLILDQLQSDNPRDWIEWQANKFASSLLLPRHTIPQAVIKKQKDLGVNRRLGTIYFDRQSDNIIFYNSIMDYLVETYETSKASIRIRLRELNILFESAAGKKPESREVSHISESLANAFKFLGEIKKNV